MAKLPQRPTSTGATSQGRTASKMSLDDIRAYRLSAMKKAVSAGLVSRAHNTAQDELAAAIHAGERLTGKALQQLIKQAKSQSGVSAAELLAFTLGNTKKNQGIKKQMNADLLRYYVANVGAAAEKFAGGISPREVINNSHHDDIKRANEQIFMATLFKRQGGQLYFLTNAGPDSKDLNHKVVVDLLDYANFLLGRTAMPKRQEIVNLLKDGKIKFDCDCGRHRYWYRYLATIGRYNHGIDENRYPSTRNPELTGVACKHVLRVMNVLMGGYGIQKLQGFIKKDLAQMKQVGSIDHKSVRMTKAQIEKEAKLQSHTRRAEHYRRRIKSTLKQAAKQLKQPTDQQIRQAVLVLQAAGIPLSAEQQQILDNKS